MACGWSSCCKYDGLGRGIDQATIARQARHGGHALRDNCISRLFVQVGGWPGRQFAFVGEARTEGFDAVIAACSVFTGRKVISFGMEMFSRNVIGLQDCYMISIQVMLT